MLTSKTHSSKNSKRILSVTIRHILDTDPDTSWLGEYSNKPTSEFSIDRAHSEDCAINTGKPVTVKPGSIYECGICDCVHPWEFKGDCRDDVKRYDGVDDYLAKTGLKESDIAILSWEDREKADCGELCDCGERGDMERGEYRYFNPSDNYTGEPAEDIRKYVRQDYERVERLNAGDWCFIGIRANAEVLLLSSEESKNDGSVTHIPLSIIQTITSGGLWGIESDSGHAYIESVEQEQLAELKTQLLALGFSKRAIATAFKNVERKDS